MIEHYDNDAPFEEDEEEVIHYFCRFTFGQFFTLIVLLVITVCCAFYLGARYGNNYLRLDGPPGSTVAQVPSPEVSSPVQELPDSVRNDEELLKMARAALQRQQQEKLVAQAQQYLQNPQALQNAASTNDSAAPVAATPPVTTAPAATTPAIPGYEPITQPPPAPVATTPRPVASSQPAAVQPLQKLGGASGLPYSVQVGSYRKIDEARRNVSRWQSDGFPAYLMEAEIPNKGRWYRVRVGAFATRTEAKNYLSDLRQQKSVDAIVVTNQ